MKEPFLRFVHIHFSRVQVNLICVFTKLEVVSCQNAFDNLYYSKASFLKRSSCHSLLPWTIIIYKQILVPSENCSCTCHHRCLQTSTWPELPYVHDIPQIKILAKRGSMNVNHRPSYLLHNWNRIQNTVFCSAANKLRSTIFLLLSCFNCMWIWITSSSVVGKTQGLGRKQRWFHDQTEGCSEGNHI